MIRWTILLLFGLVLSASSVACAHPDLSQLSPDGLRAYNNYKYVRAINDVTLGVTTAGRAGQIPRAAEIAYLTIAKQVLDVFEANPQHGKDTAGVILKNALDGLPPTVRSSISLFLQEILSILGGQP